jgi:hypothetical protein
LPRVGGALSARSRQYQGAAASVSTVERSSCGVGGSIFRVLAITATITASTVAETHRQHAAQDRMIAAFHRGAPLLRTLLLTN